MITVYKYDGTVRADGNAYLAACDSYGKITHVNSNSVDTDKSINYVEGG